MAELPCAEDAQRRIGPPSAMLFSLAVAFVVSPWAAMRLLSHEQAKHKPIERSET